MWSQLFRVHGSTGLFIEKGHFFLPVLSVFPLYRGRIGFIGNFLCESKFSKSLPYLANISEIGAIIGVDTNEPDSRACCK